MTVSESGSGSLLPDVPGAEAEVDVGICSDSGPTRLLNEDACVARAPQLGGFAAHLFAVADGLGGHSAGEVASRLVVETLEAEAARASLDRPERWLRQAFGAANLAIHDHAHDNPDAFDMQSTATALLLAGEQAFIGHVGDCRAYLIRDAAIEQCTTDHTRAVEMMRLRLITPEQAREHPARSQLTRSLGAELLINVDVLRRPLRAADVWVLCSDGLWNDVTRDEIVHAVRRRSAADAAAHLVRIACERAAQDNVSVVVVRVQRPGTAAARPGRRWFGWR